MILNEAFKLNAKLYWPRSFEWIMNNLNQIIFLKSHYSIMIYYL